MTTRIERYKIRAIKTNRFLPWKTGLIFFMAYFWSFFILLQILTPFLKVEGLLTLIVFILNAPYFLLVYFNFVDLADFRNITIMDQILILLGGSLLSFAVGVCIGFYLRINPPKEINQNEISE